MTMSLNRRALSVVETLLSQAEEFRIAVHTIEGGGRFVDCGIQARGGLLAGIELARVCLSDLARISIVPGELSGRMIPQVQVVTDHPIRACLASQYAGWAIQDGKYFAMGSGPMRAAAGARRSMTRSASANRPMTIVGVLETRKPPPPAIFAKIAAACRVEPAEVTLLAAPTASLAGGFQIVARSVETALHKLTELKFDLTRIVSAHGTAPLPPVADNDLAAIGRTNDSILYGAQVILYVTGDDASLESIGAQVPSSASHDYGEPFAAIFARYHNDFYKVDPHLFSPAVVSLQNMETGKVHSFGRLDPDVLVRSFGLERARRPMKTLAALVSGFGWHVADLQRAAERLDVVAPRDPLSRGLGLSDIGRQWTDNQGWRDRPACHRWRARADDAARQSGAGRLPDGCPAPGRGIGCAGPQSPPSRRGGCRQVSDARLARGIRHAGAGDLGRSVGDRGPDRIRRAGWRRRGQAALRLGRAGPGPDQRPRTGLADLPCARTTGCGPLPPAVHPTSGS